MIDIYDVDTSGVAPLPIGSQDVNAGFPSPGDGYYEGSLDLGRELMRNPETTFCARVRGESMVGLGIYDGDILVVDKSLTPWNGCVAVCHIDGEFTLKRLRIENGRVTLLSANPEYPHTAISPECQFGVWGVVTYVIHKMTSQIAAKPLSKARR